MSIMESIGEFLVNAADFIYSLTSGILGGEEEAPEELLGNE